MKNKKKVGALVVLGIFILVATWLSGHRYGWNESMGKVNKGAGQKLDGLEFRNPGLEENDWLMEEPEE